MPLKSLKLQTPTNQLSAEITARTQPHHKHIGPAVQQDHAARGGRTLTNHFSDLRLRPTSSCLAASEPTPAASQCTKSCSMSFITGSRPMRETTEEYRAVPWAGILIMQMHCLWILHVALTVDAPTK